MGRVVLLGVVALLGCGAETGGTTSGSGASGGTSSGTTGGTTGTTGGNTSGGTTGGTTGSTTGGTSTTGSTTGNSTGGTTGNSTGGTTGAALPTQVSIRITGATVAPFKLDETQWDLASSVSSDVVSGLLTALGAADAYAAVGAYLATATVNALSKPDPYGTAQIFVNNQWQLQIDLATTADNFEDTFTPSWPGPPGWDMVPLQSTMRISVHVVDEDLVNDDPIGDAELNYDDILAALNAQQIVQVNVADQTNNQLLFVGLSVAPQ